MSSANRTCGLKSHACISARKTRKSFKILTLFDWSAKWNMPFNTDKCEVIVFNKWPGQSDPHYTLGGYPLRWVERTRYLGIVMQSNPKFHSHIETKVRQANKVLGYIKHSLYDSPKRFRLLAYPSLCRPLLDYGDTLWGPTESSTHAENMERVQNQAIRVISGIKGRHGVTEARDQLKLST